VVARLILLSWAAYQAELENENPIYAKHPRQSSGRAIRGRMSEATWMECVCARASKVFVQSRPASPRLSTAGLWARMVCSQKRWSFRTLWSDLGRGKELAIAPRCMRNHYAGSTTGELFSLKTILSLGKETSASKVNSRSRFRRFTSVTLSIPLQSPCMQVIISTPSSRLFGGRYHGHDIIAKRTGSANRHPQAEPGEFLCRHRSRPALLCAPAD
jgi:hypothetical protein